MQIPRYDRQVEAPQQRASQAQAPAPLRQAYGEDVAQATGQLGNALAQLGQDFVRIQAKNNKDRILLETGKFDVEYKKFQADLKNRDDFENFSADTDKFLDTQLNKMKANLGDNLFNRWYKMEGQVLVDTVKAQTDIMKVPASIKQENKNLKDNIATQAYNYATSSGVNKDIIYGSIVNQIENSAQPADIKLGMIRDAQSAFAKGDIEYNMYEKPQEVINKIKGGAYKETYTDADGKTQTRSFITPQEEAKYLKQCDRLIKSRKETIKDSKVKPFYDEFEELYAQSPALANEYLNSLKDRQKLREAGLDTGQINTALRKMESAMREGEFGQESISIEQENTIAKRQLLGEVKDSQKTGDFVPIETFVSYLDSCNQNLTPSNVTTRDFNKIRKNRDEVYAVLGKSVKMEEYMPTTDIDTSKGLFFRSTNNGYLRDQLRDTFVKSGMLDTDGFKDITDQEVGMIYANAYKYCNTIDMNKTKNGKSEIAIQEAISKSLIEWAMAKYGKSAKEASEFLIGNSVLKLRKDIKEQEIGFTLNSYKD